MADEADPLKKEALAKEINELTVEAAKVSVSTEFMNLIESMGGKGLNAGTSFDVTYYHNSFPPYQINKWLEIYSQRMINPVFRTFQTELESVYEEYNMYKDDPGSGTAGIYFQQSIRRTPLRTSYHRIAGTPEKSTFE